jgi:hypothetical protein
MNANAREWNSPENPDALFIRVYWRLLAVLDVSSYTKKGGPGRAVDAKLETVALFIRRLRPPESARNGER